MPPSITIKELHATTGEHVRRAGSARTPILVTDRGEPVAVRQFSADDLGGFWTWLPLDGTITTAAANIYGTLPASVFLSSADCLHLVTALHHNFAEIHTHDRHQTAAAAALGLNPVSIRP